MNASSSALRFTLGFICGAAASIVVGSLFIPRSGIQNREQVANRGIELKNRAEETVRRAQEIANETVAKVQVAAQDIIQRGTVSATSPQ